MTSCNTGDRVGAISHADDDKIYIFGFGVYEGKFIPPKEVGGFNLGIPNTSWTSSGNKRPPSYWHPDLSEMEATDWIILPYFWNGTQDDFLPFDKKDPVLKQLSTIPISDDPHALIASYLKKEIHNG